MEPGLVPAGGYELRLIPPVPLPRKPTVELFRVPGRVWHAVRETRGLLEELQADVVVGFGGDVALPADLAAPRGQGAGVVHAQKAPPRRAHPGGGPLPPPAGAPPPATPPPPAPH